MDERKRKTLERAGWRVGSAEEFLGLSEQEAQLVAIRLALSSALRAERERLALSQVALATRLGSSQSRVAKMEAADQSVSLDLLVRSLLALGLGPKDIGKALSVRSSRKA